MPPSNSNTRLDQADTYFLGEQLRGIDPTRYYHLVPGIVGRRILPPVDGISPNKTVHGFDMIRMQAAPARKGGGRGRNAPTVNVTKTRTTQSIKTYEETATWTVDEVRLAREVGEDLPRQTIETAVAAIEQRIDGCLATGDTEAAIPGFANHSAISSINATAAWSGATPAQILGDIQVLIDTTVAGLKQGQVPGANMPMFDQFTLVMPLQYRTKWMMTRIDNTSDTTIGTFIKDNLDSVKAVKWWHRLDTANGGNPMAVLAPALDNGAINPMAGGAVLPLDFEVLPEQYDGRSVIAPCAGKCGGFAARYPVAFRYLKGM